MSPTKPPHLLYVAWGFPPSRSSGVYRALATANAFARAGWRVTVLTTTRETYVGSSGIDASLESQVDDSIEIVRIPHEAPVYQNDLTRWPRARAHFPEFWSVVRNRLDRRGFPEAVFGNWRGPLVDAAITIQEADPIDLVVATASPYVDFTPALALREKYGVPFVADYRDAWQLNVFTGERLTAPGSPIARIESGLVGAAHEIWFVNEPIRRWHQKLYPDVAERMFVVANGYDPEFARFSNSVRQGRDDGLVFGYIGTISKRAPMRELFEAWRDARSSDPRLANARLALHGYIEFGGIPSQPLLDLFEQYRDDGVEFFGPVSKADIAKTYDSFDALVLVLAEGEYVTSGKVFEYVATGLPIVSVHDPRSAASSLLADYPAWAPTADLEPQSIAAALGRGAGLALEQTPASRGAARAWAKPLERSNQLAPRVAALAEFVADRTESAHA